MPASRVEFVQIEVDAGRMLLGRSPAVRRLWDQLLRLRSDFVPDRVGHINYYSPTTIRRLLQSSNLRVLRQVTTNPSRATHRFHKGTRGLIDHCAKSVLIRAWPRLATAVFVYHGALVCETPVTTRS